MELCISGRTFRELTRVFDRLCFALDGNSVINIGFDQYNVPFVEQILGTTDYTPLSEDIEQELLLNVVDEYPNGFHSRIETTLPWLYHRLKSINPSGNFKISMPEAYGGMLVDDTYMDAYRVDFGTNSVHTHECIAAVDKATNTFVLFRPFFMLGDLGVNDESIVQCKNHDELRISDYDEKLEVLFMNMPIFATLYQFNENDALKSATVFARNDFLGQSLKSYIGSFLPTGVIVYNQ